MKRGKKIEKHVARRVRAFESLRNPKGYKCPGSQNLRKQI